MELDAQVVHIVGRLVAHEEFKFDHFVELLALVVERLTLVPDLYVFVLEQQRSVFQVRNLEPLQPLILLQLIEHVRQLSIFVHYLPFVLPMGRIGVRRLREQPLCDSTYSGGNKVRPAHPGCVRAFASRRVHL